MSARSVSAGSGTAGPSASDRCSEASEGAVLTAAEIRRRVDELLPTVGERAAEVEAARRLPADLVAALRATGVFGMPMPRSRGGPELTPREQVEIIERLATADSSVAWCAMIGSDGGYYSAFLDDDVGRHLWPEVDTVTAGWVTPAGRARRDGDGYVVDGRWQFGSGCTHADVIVAGCVEYDGDQVQRRPDGLPLARIVVAPAKAWTIHDTWFTTGLAGSGSHDYSVTGLRVPAAHTFTLFDPPRREGPLYAFPGMFFANMSGVPLGLARRAIDTVLDIARHKVVLPQGTPLRDEPRVRLAVARAEAAHGAARAYVYAALDRLWDELSTHGTASRAARVQLALSRAAAFRAAREVTQVMVETAGTQAIYASSPLDRLLRDAITMNQHIVAQERVVEMVGGMLLGAEFALPFL